MRQALLDRPTRNRRVGAISFPAPVEGWDTSQATFDMGSKRAIRLDNFFPRAEHVEIRRGYIRHANLLQAGQVETLMPYHGDFASQLFAIADGNVFDVTTDGTFTDPVLADIGSSRAQYVNFANAGGAYLWFCNGTTAPRFYNGEAFTTSDITGIDPTAIIDVEAFKGRLWLTLKDSTKVAYLGIEAIQGAAKTFELGSVMSEGGVIRTIATWSLDGGDGPDDYLAFITTMGQVIVYAGLDPDSADAWSLVGVYRIGRPIGQRCVLKSGADLAIICEDGVKPLSQVRGLDRVSQRRQSITQRIAEGISDAATAYGRNFGWQLVSYPADGMIILNVPVIEGSLSQQFVMNSETGAWCRFTGQDASCWAVFEDRLFFGGKGIVYEAHAAGSDTDRPIIADLKTAFQFGGIGSFNKRWTMAQPLLNMDEGINLAIGVDTDFADGRDLRPLPSRVADVSRWGKAVWGLSPWAQPVTQRRDWIPISGLGQCAAIRLRVEVGEMAGAAKWGQALWGESMWSASERAETLLQINGFNVTAERGDFL